MVACSAVVSAPSFGVGKTYPDGAPASAASVFSRLASNAPVKLADWNGPTPFHGVDGAVAYRQCTTPSDGRVLVSFPDGPGSSRE